MSPSDARPPRRSTAGLLAAAFAIAVVATACGASPSASPSAAPSAAPTAAPGATRTPGASATLAPPATPAPSGDTAALYRQIEDEVVAERGLPAKERLEPTILSEAEARTRLGERYRKDNPPDQIAVAEETLKALGLLSAGASLGDLYVDLLGSQVGGYYDPKAKELFVVSRSGTIGGAEKATFAHEFTHALQDQSFGLEEIDVDAVGQGDRSLGRRTLVEGDAWLLTALWLSKHLTAAEIQELLVVDPEAQAQLDKMPAILRETLLFSAQQGLIFVNGLWAEGGWQAVDRAYGRLPDSTEQVLHPAKYAADEKPVEVPLDADALAKAMGAGWAGTPEDTLGEFQLSVWLRENGVEAPAAGDAAAGWGGDRLAYLRGPNGAYALALATTWDTAADATEFLAAARTVAGNLPGAVKAERDDNSPSVWVLAASDAASLDILRRVVLAGG